MNDYRRLWLVGWPWPWDNQSRWIMAWDMRAQREGFDCGLWMAWFSRKGILWGHWYYLQELANPK